MTTLSNLPRPVLVALRVRIPGELTQDRAAVERYLRAAVGGELNAIIEAAYHWGAPSPDCDLSIGACPGCGMLVRFSTTSEQRTHSEDPGGATVFTESRAELTCGTCVKLLPGHVSADPCDRCGDETGFHDKLVVAGSPLGVVEHIEQELGVVVPDNRDWLLRVHAVTPTALSVSVLVFCRPCHPSFGSSSVAIESGYEAAYERLLQRLDAMPSHEPDGDDEPADDAD